MNRFCKILAVFCLILIFAGPPMAAAQAASAAMPFQEISPNPLDELFATFSTLTGVAMFIPAIVSALKKFGVVRDGTANTWVMALNMLAFLGLGVAQITGYSGLVPIIDAQAGVLANFLTFMIGYVYQMFASRVAYHHVLAGLPLIGMSFSGRKAGASVIADAQTE